MKTVLLLVFVFFINLAHSQLLYNENFDYYTLGNLGTDPTGVTPGQGGWLTTAIKQPLATVGLNNVFTITAEPNKGKVLTLASPPLQDYHLMLHKHHLNTLVDKRNPLNNLIKFEIDFYTGSPHYGTNVAAVCIFNLVNDDKRSKDNNTLIRLRFSPAEKGMIQYSHHNGNSATNELNLNPTSDPSIFTKLPFNTWVTFNVYLDYNNKKIYIHVPVLNMVVANDFLNKSTSTNLLQDFKPTSFTAETVSANIVNYNMVNKFDNIKLTALYEVPPEIILLSTNEQLATKFNLYPNPATNVVTITNAENMQVNQVTIYDISGKELTTQNYKNETRIQLNVEHLASGTYMLHLQTSQGTAIKKLVKK